MATFGAGMPDLPTRYFPTKEPDGVIDYTYDATLDLTFAGLVDPIVSASIATEPSGSGEITVTSLTATDTVVTVWMSGGVAGRNYIHRLLLGTAGGRTVEVLIGQVCDLVLASTPIPPAPVPGFGTTVVAAIPSSLAFLNPLNSDLIAVI